MPFSRGSYKTVKLSDNDRQTRLVDKQIRNQIENGVRSKSGSRQRCKMTHYRTVFQCQRTPGEPSVPQLAPIYGCEIMPAYQESLTAANPPAGFGKVPVITAYARQSPLSYAIPTQLEALYASQKAVHPSNVPVSADVFVSEASRYRNVSRTASLILFHEFATDRNGRPTQECVA